MPAQKRTSPEVRVGPTILRVTPTIISVLDYSKGFGHTDLVTCSASSLHNREHVNISWMLGESERSAPQEDSLTVRAGVPAGKTLRYRLPIPWARRYTTKCPASTPPILRIH